LVVIFNFVVTTIDIFYDFRFSKTVMQSLESINCNLTIHLSHSIHVQNFMTETKWY